MVYRVGKEEHRTSEVPIQQIGPEGCEEDLEEVQGMTPKLLSDVRQHFKMGEGAAAADPSTP